MRLRFVVLLFFLSSFSISAQDILFVGNSLTYTNDLPEILQKIGKQYNLNINTTCICRPNYAINDHINDGRIQQVIAQEKFDYIITQQGPSSQPDGLKMLIEDGKLLKDIADVKGIQMGYFMVWTSLAWYQTMDKVIENHTVAAEKNNALLFRVGEVWRGYQKLESKENLYQADGYHPSQVGSFMAALVIFHQLHPDKDLTHLDDEFVSNWLQKKGSYSIMVNTIRSVVD